MTLPAYKLTLTAKSDTRHTQSNTREQASDNPPESNPPDTKPEHPPREPPLENTHKPADTHGAREISNERTTTN